MCGTCGGHGAAAHAAPGQQPGDGLRVVVAGKGGTGKSTETALLARLLARDGQHVIAIDADEQRNLGATLGVDAATLAATVPVAASAGYVEEKTGARPGEGAGGLLCLNPDTADIVDRLAVTGPDGVQLLVMGGVQRAGGGCLCPENALLAAAIAGMRLRRREIVLMDTHAGVEHFGRSLARGFDTALVLTEPSWNAAQVAVETARLARELGITDVRLVVNRASGTVGRERALGYVRRLGGFPFTMIHSLPFDRRVPETEPSVTGLLGGSMIARAVSELSRQLLAGGHSTLEAVTR